MKTSLTAIFDTPRLVNPMIALKMIKTHPFFGVGYSLYTLDMKDYIPMTIKEDAAMIVHNIFLLLTAETGVIGLCFFVGIVIIPVWKITKNDLKREELFLVCMLILTLFVGICDMHPLIYVPSRLFLISLLALLALKACHTTTETQPLTRASVNKL